MTFPQLLREIIGQLQQEVCTEHQMDKLLEKFNPTPKADKRMKDYANMPIVIEHRDKVLEMLAAGKKTEAIVRATGLTRYWIQRIQATAL